MKNDYTNIIEQAGRLRTTINTPGWQDILRIKERRKSYYTDKALTEKDINKIYYAQAFVEAVDVIFLEIDELLKQSDEAERLSKRG